MDHESDAKQIFNSNAEVSRCVLCLDTHTWLNTYSGEPLYRSRSLVDVVLVSVSTILFLP